MEGLLHFMPNTAHRALFTSTCLLTEDETVTLNSTIPPALETMVGSNLRVGTFLQPTAQYQWDDASSRGVHKDHQHQNNNYCFAFNSTAKSNYYNN